MKKDGKSYYEATRTQHPERLRNYLYDFSKKIQNLEE